MNIFERLKRQNLQSKLFEEEAYRLVLEEMQSGVRREGLWAKAIAHSDGDENRVKSLYLKYRTELLLAELNYSSSNTNPEDKEYTHGEHIPFIDPNLDLIEMLETLAEKSRWIRLCAEEAVEYIEEDPFRSNVIIQHYRNKGDSWVIKSLNRFDGFRSAYALRVAEAVRRRINLNATSKLKSPESLARR